LVAWALTECACARAARAWRLTYWFDFFLTWPTFVGQAGVINDGQAI